MITAVLFDLGNTLAEYFTRADQYVVLDEAIREVQDRLGEAGMLRVTWDTAWERAKGENKEAPDYHVIPLIGRLARIFEVEEGLLPRGLAEDMCRRWLRPVFARGRRYDDSLSVLRELRSRGFKTAIVSNTPWGSPGALWREELTRLELAGEVDEAVFCTDVGWRKPARQIFAYAMGRLGVDVADCIFVGDDPRWDIAGPEAIGMEAALIDRAGATPGAISSLTQLMERL